MPEEKQGDWADHLRGAAKMLGEKYRLKVGLSGIIEGSLPIGGLSSSASVIICFLSALCKVNGIHQAVQNNSFMTLPDGKPLSSVGVRRGYSEMGRVTGPDFMEQVIAATEKSDARHYFYGTTQKNLNALLEYLKANYPQLSIVGCEPSLFRPLTVQEETALCDRINESKADFVWVALGAPRQEKFCAKLSKNTKAVWIAVGGAWSSLRK